MPKITTLMQKSGRGIDRILSLNELALHNRCGETLRQSINVGLNFPFSSSNSLCVAFNVAVPCVPQALQALAQRASSGQERRGGGLDGFLTLGLDLQSTSYGGPPEHTEPNEENQRDPMQPPGPDTFHPGGSGMSCGLRLLSCVCVYEYIFTLCCYINISNIYVCICTCTVFIHVDLYMCLQVYL